MDTASDHLDSAIAILADPLTFRVTRSIAPFDSSQSLDPSGTKDASLASTAVPALVDAPDELISDSAFIVLRDSSSTQSMRLRKQDHSPSSTRRKQGGHISLITACATGVSKVVITARPPPPGAAAPRLAALAEPKRRIPKVAVSVFLTEPSEVARSFLRPGGEHQAEAERQKAERIQRLRQARGDRSAATSVASENVASELRREAVARTQRWREEAKRREDRRRELIKFAEAEVEQKRRELVEMRRKKIEAGQRMLREADLRRLEDKKRNIGRDEARLKAELEKRAFRSSTITRSPQAPRQPLTHTSRAPAQRDGAAVRPVPTQRSGAAHGGVSVSSVPQARRPSNVPMKSKPKPRLYQLMLLAGDKRKRQEEEQRKRTLEARRLRMSAAQVPPRVNIVI
jgi:hypothetical protein